MSSGRSEKGILYGRIVSARHSRIQGKDEKEPGSVRGNDFLQLQAGGQREVHGECDTSTGGQIGNGPQGDWNTD